MFRKRRHFKVATAVAAAFTGGVLLASAGSVEGQTPWVLVSAVEFDIRTDFGVAVDLDGTIAAVGAPPREVGAPDGAVLVIDVTTGDILQTILPSDPGDVHNFGAQVSIEGSELLVGGEFDRKAWMFDWTTGVEIADFVNPDGNLDGAFGEGIDLTEDYIAIGDWKERLPDPVYGVQRGAVYVYDRGTRELIHTLRPPSFTYPIGLAVDIEGDLLAAGTAVVGAGPPEEVLLFDLLTGELVRSITNPVEYDGEAFGMTVAIEDGLLAVGAPRAQGVTGNDGRIDIFDVETGEYLRAIKPDRSTAEPRYGSSISFDGATLAVNGNELILSDRRTWAVHLYDATTGIRTQRIPGTETRDRPTDWQLMVALDGGTVAVGLPDGNIADGLYTWQIATDISLEVSPFPLIAAEPVTFSVSGAAPNESTWLLYSVIGNGLDGTFIPSLNVTTDLLQPQLAFGPRDTEASGNLIVQATTPFLLETLPIWFQAVQPEWASTWFETRIIVE